VKIERAFPISGAADMKMELTEQPQRAQYKEQQCGRWKVAMAAGLTHFLRMLVQGGLAGRAGFSGPGVRGRRPLEPLGKKNAEADRRFADSPKLSCEPRQGTPNCPS
jgi:hypothetical protein